MLDRKRYKRNFQRKGREWGVAGNEKIQDKQRKWNSER